MPPASSGDDEVSRELVRLAHEAPERGLGQFGCLVSARQYHPLYRTWRRHVAPGAEVLDWGVGNGHFSYFLLRSGYRVSGYSVDPISLEDWLPAGGYRYVQGSRDEPTKLPFADASFDAVSSIGVLEHVGEAGGDPQASLHELARVLRPAGCFVCFHLPNRSSWIEALARLLPGRHHHPVRFTRGEVERLVRQAGLELVELERYAFLPRNVWRRLPSRLGDARGVARAWDVLDALLGRVASPLCQNFAFVARRPAA